MSLERSRISRRLQPHIQVLPCPHPLTSFVPMSVRMSSASRHHLLRFPSPHLFRPVLANRWIRRWPPAPSNQLLKSIRLDRGRSSAVRLRTPTAISRTRTPQAAAQRAVLPATHADRWHVPAELGPMAVPSARIHRAGQKARQTTAQPAPQRAHPVRADSTRTATATQPPRLRESQIPLPQEPHATAMAARRRVQSLSRGELPRPALKFAPTSAMCEEPANQPWQHLLKQATGGATALRLPPGRDRRNADERGS